jgi:hypothetical protein
MSERKQTFEEWSNTWDAMFNLCVKGKIPYRTLWEHTLKYRKEWNRGKE